MTKIHAIEYHLTTGEVLKIKMFGAELDLVERAKGTHDLHSFKDVTYLVPLDKVAYVVYVHGEEPC